MRGCKRARGVSFFLLFAFFTWSSSLEIHNAREGDHHVRVSKAASAFAFNQKERAQGHLGQAMPRLSRAGYHTGEKAMSTSKKSNGSNVFNVLDYGAKGDGKTDDTKAFQSAWAVACKASGSTLVVPSGSVFLVKPVSFTGPNCQPNIIFQLDGIIIAPTSSEAWGSGVLQWLEFKNLKGFTVKGRGVIDGQGSVWWKKDIPTDNPTQELAVFISQQLALRFYGSDAVTVTGITIQNSPQTHLKFDSCTRVLVSSFTVSSPGNSTNTDGIHLQNSQDVLIYNSNLSCGDDCISIQTGCSRVHINGVNCGPGHGISIGGLGKGGTKACVTNITVRNINLQNTLTGVRIKTWQGGSGSVQGIAFSNIKVSGVQTPIIIDQYYCDKSECANKTSAVKVAGISYVNIQGTYTVKPVHLACSDSVPCKGLTLDTIDLEPQKGNQNWLDPFCWQAYGEAKPPTVPPINCLQSGNSSSSNVVDSC